MWGFDRSFSRSVSLSAIALAVAGCGGKADAGDDDRRLAQMPRPVCLEQQGLGSAVYDSLAESPGAAPISEREAIRAHVTTVAPHLPNRYVPLKQAGGPLPYSYWGHRTADGRISVVLGLSREYAAWRVNRASYCYD